MILFCVILSKPHNYKYIRLIKNIKLIAIWLIVTLSKVIINEEAFRVAGPDRYTKGLILRLRAIQSLGFWLESTCHISLGKDNDDDATIDEVIKDNVKDRTVLQGLLDCLIN